MTHGSFFSIGNLPVAAATAEIDVVGPWQVTIDNVHHEIHEGDAFGAYKTVTLNASASTYISIWSATSYNPHFRLVGVQTSMPNVFVSFRHHTTASATKRTADKAKGTAISTYNRNRLSSAVAHTTIKATATNMAATITSTFDTYFIPGSVAAGGVKSGGAVSADVDEWILSDNTLYSIKILNGAATGTCNLRMFFYEEGTGH